jgi:hypothetical protein
MMVVVLLHMIAGCWLMALVPIARVCLDIGVFMVSMTVDGGDDDDADGDGDWW